MSAGIKLVSGLVGGVLVIGGFVAVAATLDQPSDRSGVVQRVVDGDTIVAEVGQEHLTVRLLNVDTPELKHPDMAEQCLAQEASDWLNRRLPPGTTIELGYDVERLDSYGRTLAGVFEGGSLVNAEIAEVGLGLPLLVEPNRRFHRDVESAHELAEREQVGLFDPSVDCTVAALADQMEATANSIPVEFVDDVTFASSEAAVASIVTAAALLHKGDLVSLGNQILLADEAVLWSVTRSVDESRRTAELSLAALQSSKREWERAENARLERLRAEREAQEEAARVEQERRETEERERREAEERERREAEERERREAEERERRERAQREQRERETAKSSPVRTPSSGRDSSSKSSKSGKCVPYGPEIPYSADGGYTGKRYGMPGGKTFRKCS